ncbi:MAG: hypothetical protein KDE53_30495 [Caldilineaceae bacterium]|nr:hypothetical protein [Caldilineaceae bacterium]
MPFQQTPWVRNGCLRLRQHEVIQLDTPAWFAWLAHTTTFCYMGTNPLIRLTVRYENRRHQSYWYAYCKYQRKLHNIYLGKQEQLTQARLEEACQVVWQRIRCAQQSGQV